MTQITHNDTYLCCDVWEFRPRGSDCVHRRSYELFLYHTRSAHHLRLVCELIKHPCVYTDLQTALLTVFGDETLIGAVDTQSNEPNNVIVLQIPHLLHSTQKNHAVIRHSQLQRTHTRCVSRSEIHGSASYKVPGLIPALGSGR